MATLEAQRDLHLFFTLKKIATVAPNTTGNRSPAYYLSTSGIIPKNTTKNSVFRFTSTPSTDFPLDKLSKNNTAPNEQKNQKQIITIKETKQKKFRYQTLSISKWIFRIDLCISFFLHFCFHFKTSH